jgi:TRAP-type mannitol/chloroaromatic compound transport system permease large subunit
LRGVAPDSVSTGMIYRGVLPFVGLQILAIAILFVFPGLATWLPGLIYG